MAAGPVLGAGLGFDLSWGALLGFVLADVSPAVAVPLLLELQREGFGVVKGIPSVLLAAASLNAVLAICGFGVALHGLNITGGEGLSSSAALGLGAVEIVGGLFVGSLMGWVVTFLFEICAVRLLAEQRATTPAVAALAAAKRLAGGDEEPNLELLTARGLAMALCLAASGTIFLAKALHMEGGGALGAVALGAAVQSGIAGRRESSSPEIARRVPWGPIISATEEALAFAWASGAQVGLFTLLGAAIDINRLETSYLLRGSILVLVGLGPRALGAYLCTGCIDNSQAAEQEQWNHNERLFSAIAWCPKVRPPLLTHRSMRKRALCAFAVLTTGGVLTLPLWSAMPTCRPVARSTGDGASCAVDSRP